MTKSPRESRRSARRRAVLERWSRAARRGDVPTREQWWDDLRQLGEIHLNTARELGEDGRLWPWIPPFELDQVEELAGRAVGGEAKALIRQTAAEDLRMRLDAAAAQGGEDSVAAPVDADDVGRRVMTAPALQEPSSNGEASERGRRFEDDASMPSGSSPAGSGLRVAWSAPPVRRWRSLVYAGLSLALLLGLGFLFLPDPDEPQVVEPMVLGGPEVPWVGEERERVAGPPPVPSATLPAQALLEMMEAFAASSDPRLQTLFQLQLEPLLTLDGEAIGRRPEMAEAILAAALLRSGLHPLGLVHEKPLLVAAHCDFVGPPRRQRPAGCPDEAPVEALRGLIEWIWSNAEAESGEESANDVGVGAS